MPITQLSRGVPGRQYGSFSRVTLNPVAAYAIAQSVTGYAVAQEVIAYAVQQATTSFLVRQRVVVYSLIVSSYLRYRVRMTP